MCPGTMVENYAVANHGCIRVYILLVIRHRMDMLSTI